MALNKYKQVLVGYKDSEKGLAGDQLYFGAITNVTMEQFCTCDKVDANDGSGDIYLVPDRCRDF